MIADRGITLGVSAGGRADLQIQISPVNVLGVAELDRIAELVCGAGAARDVLRAGRREALATALPRAEEAYRRLAGSPDLRRAVREFSQRTVQPR